jgi:hypothetical protein
MNANNWRNVALALLIATAPSTAAAAADTIEGREPIPTMLVTTGDSTQYPDPICSKCIIIVTEDDDEGADGARADVRVGYPTDAPPFAGQIGVTVWLQSDERRTVWLSDVTLAPGDAVELEAAAEVDWSWDQVRFVWLRFVEG